MGKMNRVRHLYLQMPGSPGVPFDNELGELWGEVEGNTHYAFCELIVDMMDKQIGEAVAALAADHQLV